MWNCYKTMINRATDFQWSIAKHVSSKVILAASLSECYTEHGTALLTLLKLFPNEWPTKQVKRASDLCPVFSSYYFNHSFTFLYPSIAFYSLGIPPPQTLYLVSESNLLVSESRNYYLFSEQISPLMTLPLTC